jgi:DNA end-binding protein Ku
MLVLELMHFADELVPTDGFKIPEAKLGKREEEMAMTLVDQMTEKWDPERYTDEYKSALMKLIERKVDAGGKELPGEKPKARAATNVIDLVEVLQRSLSEAGKGKGGRVAKKKAPATKRRAHPSHHKKAA